MSDAEGLGGATQIIRLTGKKPHKWPQPDILCRDLNIIEKQLNP